MSYVIIQIEQPQERQHLCKVLTDRLPLWFGLPDENAMYLKDAGIHSGLGAFHNDTAIGLLIYKSSHYENLGKCLDIHWLAIDPDFHGQGAGTALIDKFVELAQENHYVHVSVETLDPKIKNPQYLKTFAFYEAKGFKIWKRHESKFDEKMVRMVREV